MYLVLEVNTIEVKDYILIIIGINYVKQQRGAMAATTFITQ